MPPRAVVCCGFCSEAKRPDVSVCNSCFVRASKVVSSMATLGQFETVDSAGSETQLVTAWRRAILLKSYVGFLTQSAAAFTDQIHTDILLKPGQDNGPPIPAHKALLAAKSIVFKNMFDSDICKAPSKTDELLTFPEMNHVELKTFLEFLYYGRLSTEVAHKHASSLFSAARKYEIPFLEKFLVHVMFWNLKVQNALEILEIASTCSIDSLKFAPIEFIGKNTSVVLSPEFESFACKNPSLAVEVSRDLAKNLKRPCPT